MATRWDERFLASTRGQVASHLRLGSRTVEELAHELGVTDNAVRAHLSALERDGLVVQGEPRRSGGKPAYSYRLAPAAERLFPKAYGLMLNQLVAVLSERLPKETLDDALREVGQRIARDQPAPQGELRTRVDAALAALSELGGAARVERTNEGYVIHGCNCPLSAAVDASPGACLMAETLLTELIGEPVQQTCDPGPPPRCRFVIAAD